MSIITSALNTIQDVFDQGDPLLRRWFLVGGYFWQMFLPFLYVMFVKVWGPSLMKNRHPFRLDIFMIIYNFSVVFTYSSCVLGIVYSALRYNMLYMTCAKLILQPHTPLYDCLSYLYVIYLLKYVEFFDTISFVLKKKYSSITNLHLVHHATLPFVGWFLFRSEFSGYQAVPVIINSCVHVLMYFYYGVAAMGPKFRRFIWWKKYLTIIQMVQFVIITILASLISLTGCKTARHGILLSIVVAVCMFVLFCNFYIGAYQRPAKNRQEVINHKEEKKN